MIRRALLTALVVLLPSLTSALPSNRTVGDTRVLASTAGTVPFPEGVAVKGNKAYVSGPATFPTAGTPASRIGIYDIRTGALVREVTIQGQDTTQEHALSNVAFDDAGRLYVIDTQQGVLRLDLETGEQEHYAPPLPLIVPGSFPLPNELVFDDAGWLYITDSFQGTLWRIPPGGGAPRPWFQAPELLTGPFRFGPNGARLSPSRTELWFVHSESGILYALPLVDQPRLSDLRRVYQFAPGNVPDGMAFGKSGRLYVALAQAHQVAVLDFTANGVVESRLGGTEAPWEAPASVAFTHEGSVLVTNHALFTGNPEHFLLLDLFVGEQGLPLAKPVVP
jgi:sugar lactone lactonase YvrE